MKKVILSVVLISVMSFAGSFKLGNTYFNQDGTSRLDSRIYYKKYSKIKLTASYRKNNNVSSVKIKNINNKILVSK